MTIRRRTTVSVSAAHRDRLEAELRATIARLGREGLRGEKLLAAAAADALREALRGSDATNHVHQDEYPSRRNPRVGVPLEDFLSEVVANAPATHRAAWLVDALGEAFGFVYEAPPPAPRASSKAAMREPISVGPHVRAALLDEVEQARIASASEKRPDTAARMLEAFARVAQRFELGAETEARIAAVREDVPKKLAQALVRGRHDDERAVDLLLDAVKLAVVPPPPIDVPKVVRARIERAVAEVLGDGAKPMRVLARALVGAVASGLEADDAASAKRLRGSAEAVNAVACVVTVLARRARVGDEQPVAIAATEALAVFAAIAPSIGLRFPDGASGKLDTARLDGARARAYSPGARFVLADVIEHPRFGRGLVTEAASSHVVVAFRDGSRKLAHGR